MENLNITKPTPAIWGNIAAVIVGISAICELYEDKIGREWFTFATIGMRIVAMGLIVFTGVKKPNV